MAQPQTLKGKKRYEVVNDYEAFIEKFKPKRTTDDCMTPEAVYNAVVDWVDENLCRLEGRRIVRPFWPGGDYEAFDYREGDVVIDNPPFSISAKILDYYNGRGVKYFLFAPTLTAGSALRRRGTAVVFTGLTIEYENRAKIATCFATNLFTDGTKILLAGSLGKEIAEANKRATVVQRVLEYPDCLTSPAKLNRLAKRVDGCRIYEHECEVVSKACNADIYGGGILLSERATVRKAEAGRAAAERAEAERAEAGRAAAERAAAERAVAERLELTDRDKEIIARLNRHGA